MFANVLVEYNAKSIDKTFTYLVPIQLRAKLKRGMKVLVPFGNKQINGFVLSLKDKDESDINIKEITEIVNEELILSDELLELGVYMQSRTLCSKITAYQTMLPSSLKIKNHSTDYKKYLTYIVLNTSEDAINSYINMYPNRKKQIEILEALLVDHKIERNIINSSALKTLLEIGLVKEEKEEYYRIDYGTVLNPEKKVLSADQQKVVDGIDLQSHSVNLIHGVTGSGKTEVYLNLIEKTLNKGKTAILLVPEITLTVQTLRQFYERFGNKVAILHSALNDGEKSDEYLKILRGDASIVIGTRSAIFAPLKNLGIIIIDEEHSETYKQETNPRYHALDMAKFRAEYNNIPLILGSATPSLESMARAKKGVYNLFSMPNRIGASVLPKCHIVDMHEEMKRRNTIFSELLANKINERLMRKEQIIILLNRRGFSTVISCQSCGETFTCPHCEITLTYHKSSNHLRCHYCGYTILKPDVCPSCKEEALNYLGLGTEKLEEEILKKFDARVARLDADTTSRKGMHEKIIKDFQDYKYDILVGTQMVSKGLDFPLVTLVGVINADATLNIPDFRSSERTFELLSQVSGRAGRKTANGEVVIQTFNPDNFTIKSVCDNDYLAFYNYEMNNRRILKYSPYYYLISIKVASKEYQEASSEATKVKEYLKNKLLSTDILLGPTTASMFKINNIYRFQLIIKYREEKHIIELLKELDEMCALNKKVNLEIDINPTKI